ncbi:MAG: hypothetical protein GC165_08395 [Armatimonadetes bacterium]|nr:hypothetical protein [Armatimonadota bacterium]
MSPEARLKRIRLLVVGFIIGLALSGITAFPLTWELDVLVRNFGQGDTGTAIWLRTVQAALHENDVKYPFIAYGTDWLAFGHLVIATAFFGPLKDPVRNKWIIDWGIIACLAVPFLALIAGPIRGIPVTWRLIDCSFGVVGIVPLLIVRKDIQILEVAAEPGS